ncbi:MAG: NAD-dependent epimerase/dehydratase family protein [Actinomycetota bacterium]|nr:NAD-dependent epimerase/dehydratase family protein [Actinomycetota bacterium]
MTPTDLVTGAFSYSGSHIARQLLNEGRHVRTLTFHPDREHSLRADVAAHPYRFDDPVALARSLAGVQTFYNTYWVRFNRGQTTFTTALEHSRMLFFAAKRAGVQRIVHVSITNPSIDSALPYFRGKALVESALAQIGTPYSIIRPTWLFGGERDVLVNNIAWILRRAPVFAMPGRGRYPVQPVHVDDLARICIEAARADDDAVVDAAGPERMPFVDLITLIRTATGRHGPVVPLPPALMTAAARALGLLLGDVVLTPDEITGLMDGLLVSNDRPRGEIAFSDWLDEHASSLGSSYANELERHFSARR